jgi:hypothetical protein
MIKLREKEARQRPLLLIDVDGVLTPTTGALPPGFRRSDDAERPIAYHEKHGEWLRELAEHFDLVWGSSWMESANDVYATLLGLDPLPWIDFPRPHGGISWKLEHVQRYVGERAFAWVDDEFYEAEPAWAVERHAPTLLVPVRGSQGLTKQHFEHLRSWAMQVAEDEAKAISTDELPETLETLRALDQGDDEYYEVLLPVLRLPAGLLLMHGRRLVESTIDSDRALGADLLGGVIGIRYFSFDADVRLAILAEQLDDPSPDVVYSALQSIGNLEGAAAVRELAAFAEHEDPELREAVVHGMFLRENEPAAVEALLQLMADEENRIREWAVHTLNSTGADGGDVRKSLWDRVEDSDPYIRAEAICALAERQDPRVLDPLLDLLDELGEEAMDDSGTQHATVQIARLTGDRRLRRHLRTLLAIRPGPADLDEALRACFQPGEPEYAASTGPL